MVHGYARHMQKLKIRIESQPENVLMNVNCFLINLDQKQNHFFFYLVAFNANKKALPRSFQFLLFFLYR